MGTPEFAVPALEALVKASFNVVGVITAPDKPAGRGRQISESAVKIKAVELGLHILQPTSLKDPAFIEELRALKADLQIVVAFRMLPEAVWNMPPLGTFNLHASLLPQYRGAAPINWAIINGETESGITTFFLKHEIDTGNILFQIKEPISPEDNVGDLYKRLMLKGADLVVDTVKAIEAKKYTEIPQTENKDVKHAPKIFKETCELHWDKPVAHLHNLVRGLSPYPAAFFAHEGKTYKVFKTTYEKGGKQAEQGTVDSDGKTFVKIRSSDGWLSLVELQPEGKKRIKVEEFLRGNKI